MPWWHWRTCLSEVGRSGLQRVALSLCPPPPPTRPCCDLSLSMALHTSRVSSCASLTPVCWSTLCERRTLTGWIHLSGWFLLLPRVAESGVDVSLSGSTAVVALLRAGVFHVINVGDSRAVIGTSSKIGRVQPVQLSLDHKPDLPAEKARILAVGGRVLATRNKYVELQIDWPLASRHIPTCVCNRGA